MGSGLGRIHDDHKTGRKGKGESAAAPVLVLPQVALPVRAVADNALLTRPHRRRPLLRHACAELHQRRGDAGTVEAGAFEVVHAAVREGQVEVFSVV